MKLTYGVNFFCLDLLIMQHIRNVADANKISPLPIISQLYNSSIFFGSEINYYKII